MHQSTFSSFLWSVAHLVRGDYKQVDYGKVILPFTVLHRLDWVLAPTKEAVLAEHALRAGQGMNPEAFVQRKARRSFANPSSLDMKRLMGDADQIASNLHAYVQRFSPAVRDIVERFESTAQLDHLAKAVAARAPAACPAPA